MATAVIAAVGVVVGAVQNDRAQDKTDKFRKQQAEQQKKVAAIAGAKERRETARAARIKRAMIINSAAQNSTGQSSSAYSAIGNINAQEREDTETSFANQALSTQSSGLLSSAAASQSRANLANSIAGLASSMIQPKTTTTPKG